MFTLILSIDMELQATITRYPDTEYIQFYIHTFLPQTGNMLIKHDAGYKESAVVFCKSQQVRSQSFHSTHKDSRLQQTLTHATSFLLHAYNKC